MSLVLLFLPTTAPSVVIPTVTTGVITNINPTYGVGSGQVTSAGNGTITEFGLVYARHTNPTTSDSKIIATGNYAAFSAIMSLLSSNTTYYFRAYAINSAGVGYGSTGSFTTASNTVLQKKFYYKVYDTNLKYV